MRVFAGPNGSGKSSIIKEIKKLLTVYSSPFSSIFSSYQQVYSTYDSIYYLSAIPKYANSRSKSNPGYFSFSTFTFDK